MSAVAIGWHVYALTCGVFDLGLVGLVEFLTQFLLTRIVGIVFGLSHWLPQSVAALVLLGASDMSSVVIRAPRIQRDTPDALRGRVRAVNAVFIGTFNQLDDFESGLTAALLGTVGRGSGRRCGNAGRGRAVDIPVPGALPPRPTLR